MSVLVFILNGIHQHRNTEATTELTADIGKLTEFVKPCFLQEFRLHTLYEYTQVIRL